MALSSCTRFLEDGSQVLKTFEPNIILGEKAIIFGDIKNGPEPVVNTVLVLSKMFLWAQKFTSKRLDSAQYINYLKRELKSIFIICKVKELSLLDCKNWTQLLTFFDLE